MIARRSATKVRQNIVIKGRRTSLMLEPLVWDALTEMCRMGESSLDDLCETIVEKADDKNMTSAIRVAVIQHFMERCGVSTVDA